MPHHLSFRYFVSHNSIDRAVSCVLGGMERELGRRAAVVRTSEKKRRAAEGILQLMQATQGDRCSATEE
jgi:hypothetical protein